MFGFDVFKCLCVCNFNFFVLILIVVDSVDECVKGFDFGVDDYMVKLFVFNEFEVCVCVLIWCGVGGGLIVVCYGLFVFD